MRRYTRPIYGTGGSLYGGGGSDRCELPGGSVRWLGFEREGGFRGEVGAGEVLSASHCLKKETASQST